MSDQFSLRDFAQRIKSEIAYRAERERVSAADENEYRRWAFALHRRIAELEAVVERLEAEVESLRQQRRAAIDALKVIECCGRCEEDY